MVQVLRPYAYELLGRRRASVCMRRESSAGEPGDVEEMGGVQVVER